MPNGPEHARVDPIVLGSTRAHDTDRPDIETASDQYAARFTGPAGEWFLARQAEAVATLLARLGPEPLRILELGGGHAQITPVLLAAGHSLVVHGSAAECFGRIAPLRREHADQLSVTTASLWELPFADRAFDLVISVRLLAHVVRWRELMQEMARLARRYIVIEFARAAGIRLPQSANDALFSLKHRVEGTTRPFLSHRQRTLETELRSNGFEPAATVAQFALPMVLHRLISGPEVLRRAEQGLRRFGVGDAMRSPVLLLAERNGTGDAEA